MDSKLRSYIFYGLRLLRVITSRRRAATKKRDATTSGTALELRRLAAADREEEQKRRDERRALERRAALDDAEAKIALETAKADAAEKRRLELETCRLAALEEDARKAKVARAAEDARWLQVDFPLALCKQLIEWRAALTPDQEASFKARVRHLVRFRRLVQVETPYFWDEDVRFTSFLGNVLGVDKSRHSVRCSKSFEWVLYRNAWAAGSPNDAVHQLHRLWDKVAPDGHSLFQGRFTSQILLHDNQYVVEKAFVNGVFLMYKWMGVGWLPGGEFTWPPTRA